MAASGSNYVTVANTTIGSEAVRLVLQWWTNWQDVATNKSSVHFRIYVQTFGAGAMYGSASKTWTLTVNGSQVRNGTFTVQQGSNSTKILCDHDMELGHDAVGNCSFSASAFAQFRMNFNGWKGDYTVSLNGSLDNIPRASTPSVTGSLTLGEQQTIKTNRAASSFTHTVKYRYGNGAYTGTIAEGVGADTTWTPPLSFANNVTTADSFDIAIILDTYSGGTLLGTKETIVKLKLPSSMVPSFKSSSITDSKGYLDKYGAFVQGQSVVVANMAASGSYGSTITGYEASLDGLSASGTPPLTLGAPTIAGDRSVTLTATDSRGRKITGTKAIKVAACAAPKLTASAYRYDTVAQEESDESTTIRVEVAGSVENVNNKGLNSGRVAIKYRIRDAASWTTLSDQARGQSFSFTIDIPNCPETNVYEVQVEVTDGFGQTAAILLEVGTAHPVMDWRGDGKGVAFYGIADRPGVRVNNLLSVGNGYGIDLEDEDDVSQPFVRVQANGRPVLKNHTALENAMWLQLLNANGTATNFARMNANSEIELNWTKGGFRGRAFKLIWSGNANAGATLSIPELPYYNVFIGNAGYGTCVIGAVDPGSGYRRLNMGATYGDGGNTHALTVTLDITDKATSTSARLMVCGFNTISGSGTPHPWYGKTLLALYGVL